MRAGPSGVIFAMWLVLSTMGPAVATGQQTTAKEQSPQGNEAKGAASTSEAAGVRTPLARPRSWKSLAGDFLTDQKDIWISRCKCHLWADVPRKRRGRRDVLLRRVPVEEKGAHPRAEKMVGATGPERTEALAPAGAGEVESIFVVREVGDDPAIRGKGSSQSRENLCRNLFPVAACGMFETAEERTLRSRENKVSHLIDRRDAAEVALALRIAPGKQSVA